MGYDSSAEHLQTTVQYNQSCYFSAPDDCDFENAKKPLCHWTIMGRLFIRFYRVSGGRAGVGPNGDHTKNGGANSLISFSLLDISNVSYK